MKKILIVFSLLFLVACNNVHENIDEGMAKDAKDIIKIIETTIKKDRDFTDREEGKLDSYVIKYGALESDNRLTDEERRLFILTEKLIKNYNHYAYLESDDGYLEEQKEYINRVLKTGKMYD